MILRAATDTPGEESVLPAAWMRPELPRSGRLRIVVPRAMPDGTHPQGLSMGPGYHSVNPYFLVRGVDGFIEFLAEVFGGQEEPRFKEVRPDGLVDHADVVIGDSIVMMSDADATNPPRPSVAFVYVPDVDSTYRRALDRGCVSRLEPRIAPWGERVAGFTDPWDNRWWIGVPGPGGAGV